MPEEKEPSTPLGALVREHRKRRNWNQTQLGEALDVSKSTAADLETGPERKIPMERYTALERVFKVPLMVWIQASTPAQVGIVEVKPDDLPAVIERIAAEAMLLPEADRQEVLDYVLFRQRRAAERAGSTAQRED